MSGQMRRAVGAGVLVLAVACFSLPAAAGSSAEQEARRILAAAGVRGGLVVHLGCGDGRLTAALRASDAFLVHGLDPSAAHVEEARRHIREAGLYGKVSVDVCAGMRRDGGAGPTRLPYVDNLVNLVVAEDLGRLPMAEVMRVLCPNGVAYIRNSGAPGRRSRGEGGWTKTVKPRPKEIDDWTHYLHDATNNAVAHDTVVGPPRRMQWVGGPRYARHHDRMSSVSAAVSSGGRVFYIFDEATPASILAPSRWALIARDAFNGTVLWKRRIDKWHTHLWPLKSGPAQLPRRLVALDGRVYVTLSLDGPLVALDAATGETVRTYKTTKATEEVILADGVLFALVHDAGKADYDGRRRFGRGYGAKSWDASARKLMAVRAGAGEVLWTVERRVLPATLAADSRRVIFHDGESIVCLDRKTGKDLWRSAAVPRSREIRSFYLPTLVLYEDVVLFSGGETAGMQTGSWYTSGKDTLTALSAQTGKGLWTAYHPPSGYRSPEDLLVVNGLVWTGETTSGRAVGIFTGRDPHTGKVKSEFPPDVKTYWFHHRCHRGKATDNYLLMARAGTEFIDVRKKHWIPNYWVRGACLYGVMPANGLLYAPQHPCACYLETKLSGFNALAPASAGPRVPEDAAKDARLEKGPAYAEAPAAKASTEDWPTYRHDAARSGHAGTSVPAAVKPAWQVDLGGKLTSPVVAGGKVFVASVDAHSVHALDAESGKRVWRHTAGGRVDSPPTIHQGRVLFGSADGWVYCLRAADGELAWRFRAAPMDQRLTARGQVESVWPVHGSVLVQDGVLYCVAGRSMFLDGGLHLWRLDPKTGGVLSRTLLGDIDPKTKKDLQAYVSWLNMPPALPDILSSDGRLVYMRSQPFKLDGTRLPLAPMPHGPDADRGALAATHRAEQAHLFCPTGFLDDTWWHRTYWLYGSMFVSGWCGYFRAGMTAPAGRILVFDDSTVYGFGRKPRYYRWTTPIEHHLFAADKTPPAPGAAAGASASQTRIRVGKSESLNPTGKPVTVEAWLKADKPGGVVLAKGGGAHGYALYLQGGRPHFVVRVGGEAHRVGAKQRVVGRWAHLAGVVTSEKELRIHVDGKLAASSKTAGLVAADPQEAMEIGADEGSAVGDYRGPMALTGLLDEVRVYHRALSAAEIEKHAAGVPRPEAKDRDLVLAYSFEDGKAADLSGHGNHGKVDGAVPAAGKTGRGMKFTGGARRASGFKVNHRWAKDLPLLPRAMVLARGSLFIAGPADLVDEEQAMRQIGEPKVESGLKDQVAALEGRRGALLWAVATADGERIAEMKLPSLPVFDGMAAANGGLYLATVDGKVICLTGR